MRILFAIKSLENPGGGAERVFADVIREIDARKHKVKILTFDKKNHETFYKIDKGVDRISIGIGDVSKPSGMVETIRRVLAIRSEVLRQQPNVVVGFMHSMFIPLSIALIGTGIPVVGSEHIVREHYRGKMSQWVLLCASSIWIEKMTAVSDQAKASYPGFIRRKMSIIPNPVSINVRKKADVLASGKRKVLLAVGSLRKQKNFLTLIEAFRKVVDSCPEWDLRIVGEGEEREALTRRISELGLGGRVVLPGATNDIRAEYENAQLYVNASLYESQGLTTVEAIVHGLPAIGFEDCPGTNEIIQNNFNGILVPANIDTVSTLAVELIRMMGGDKLRVRMGKAGLGKYVIPAPEVVIQKWITLLKSISAAPN